MSSFVRLTNQELVFYNSPMLNKVFLSPDTPLPPPGRENPVLMSFDTLFFEYFSFEVFSFLGFDIPRYPVLFPLNLEF